MSCSSASAPARMPPGRRIMYQMPMSIQTPNMIHAGHPRSVYHGVSGR